MNIWKWLQENSIWLTTLISLLTGIVGFFVGKMIERNARRNTRDQSILTRINNILTKNGTIAYMREQDFGDKFSLSFIESLETLVNIEKNDPELIFINNVLEKAKQDLIQEIKSFIYWVGINCNDLNLEKTIVYINAYQSEDNTENINIEKLRIEGNKLAENICIFFDKLNTCGRKQLF